MLYIGKKFNLMINGVVTNSMVACLTIFCEVIHYTENAYKLRIENIDSSKSVELWLPKKAIEEWGTVETTYRIASWFKPSEYQERVFHRLGHVSGVSA